MKTCFLPPLIFFSFCRVRKHATIIFNIFRSFDTNPYPTQAALVSLDIDSWKNSIFLQDIIKNCHKRRYWKFQLREYQDGDVQYSYVASFQKHIIRF